MIATPHPPDHIRRNFRFAPRNFQRRRRRRRWVWKEEKEEAVAVSEKKGGSQKKPQGGSQEEEERHLFSLSSSPPFLFPVFLSTSSSSSFAFCPYLERTFRLYTVVTVYVHALTVTHKIQRCKVWRIYLVGLLRTLIRVSVRYSMQINCETVAWRISATCRICCWVIKRGETLTIFQAHWAPGIKRVLRIFFKKINFCLRELVGSSTWLWKAQTDFEFFCPPSCPIRHYSQFPILGNNTFLHPFYLTAPELTLLLFLPRFFPAARAVFNPRWKGFGHALEIFLSRALTPVYHKRSSCKKNIPPQ